jgi:hypothetical protein
MPYWRCALEDIIEVSGWQGISTRRRFIAFVSGLKMTGCAADTIRPHHPDTLTTLLRALPISFETFFAKPEMKPKRAQPTL